jgi:predicted ATP-binding protein involved in virulence
MIINSISLRNFKSYGNNLQKLTFPKEGSLILLTGQNGNGKCLSPDTEIDVEIDDNIIKEQLINFLENRKFPL